MDIAIHNTMSQLAYSCLKQRLLRAAIDTRVNGPIAWAVPEGRQGAAALTLTLTLTLALAPSCPP